MIKLNMEIGRILPILRLPLNECVTWRKLLTVSQSEFIHSTVWER